MGEGGFMFPCYIAELQWETIGKWQQTWRKINLRSLLFIGSPNQGKVVDSRNERHLLGRWVMACLTEQKLGNLSISWSKEMMYEKMSPVFKVRCCCLFPNKADVLILKIHRGTIIYKPFKTDHYTISDSVTW